MSGSFIAGPPREAEQGGKEGDFYFFRAALLRYFLVHGQASMQMPQIVESISSLSQNSVALRQQAQASKKSSRS